MAVQGMGEGRLRGSWDDDRPRRKRPLPSRLEEEEEEEGWGGRGGGGPPGSLDKDDRERPPARKTRGRPWPDLEEKKEEKGRREGGRWGCRRRESGRGPREPSKNRGRSRSPPRERAWRRPPSLGHTSRPSRAKAPSSSSSSCSPGRDRRRGSPAREAPQGRSWESPGVRPPGAAPPEKPPWRNPGRTTWRKRPLKEDKKGRQPTSPSRRAVERGRLERSSSSTGSYRSKRGPGWEARQEYVQDQGHQERDQYQGKADGDGQRGPKYRDRGSSSYAGGEGVWGSPSRGRRQASPARGSPEWKKDREDSPSYSIQSHSDWDHRRRSWDSPEQKGKEQESWSRGDGLEMHHSSNEDPEDRDRSTGFEEEWILNKSRAVPKSLQGGLGGPEGRPKIYTGPDKRSVAPVTWAPRNEVVDYWNQSQSIMEKSVQEYFLGTCCRPTLPDKSCITPRLNPSIQAMLNRKQVKKHSTKSSFLSLIHEELLNMMAPAMTIYEMAEESIEKQEPVNPQELREWTRRVFRYIGSMNQRLRLQRCFNVLEAINPRVKSMMYKVRGPSAGGLLFAEDKANVLKSIIQSFPEVQNEPGDTIVRNDFTVPKPRDGRRRRGSGKYGAAERHVRLSARQSFTAEVPREKEASLHLWHRRFGHRDPKLILEMQNHNLAAGIKVSDAGSPTSCAICLKIKGAGTPSPPRVKGSSTKVLELIHVGLHEPFHVSSREKKRYILAFVDDFSRYCTTYLLKEEREMEAAIGRYIKWLGKTFGRKPKAFQMGDGTEGLSDDSRARLENEGIVLRRSDAQSSELSGSAKWEITSLLEMTRCMLADAHLHDNFWGDALRTATFLLNRLPAEGTRKIPFELWYGYMPRLGHIRVFGSLAYTYVPVRKRRDSGSNREQAIFLGYIPSTKMYSVMNVETGDIHIKSVSCFVEDEKVDQSEVVLDVPESDGRKVGPSFATEPGSNSMQEEDGTTAEVPSEKEASLQLWHRRFGHRDPKLILEMQNHNLAVGIKVSDAGSPTSCAICLKIKGAGIPSPPRTKQRSTEVLDLIHVGLHGPFHVPCRANKRYILAFVDDCSRYCRTYQLKEEREMEEIIGMYIKCLGETIHRQPKAFQMGDGTEGLSDNSRARLENEGIVLRRSDAQSSECGSAKWEITSLLEMTRCMLADAQLPEKFWGDALMTATYLLNSLPADGTGKTPCELWYGYMPSLDHIRVFGSLAYYIPVQKRRDSGSNREQGILLGYIPSTRLYKVMNVETGKIHRRLVSCFVVDEKVDQGEVVLDIPESDERKVGPSFATEPGSNSMQEEDGTTGECQALGERGRDGGVKPAPVEDAPQTQNAPEPAIGCSPRLDRGASDPASNCPASSLPGTWEEVEQMPAAEGSHWREAARKEFEALHQREAWALTQLPAGQRAMGCKWAFAAKQEAEGERYTARLLAEGFLLEGGEDPAETFGPVVQESTLRMLMNLAASKQMQVRHLEVTAEIAQELYMEQPPGFTNQERPDWVYKLKKSLFGLKEAAQARNEKLKVVLAQEGFKQDCADPCLYSRSQNGYLSFILACVEDLVVATQREQEYTGMVGHLGGQLEVKELGDATGYLASQMKSAGMCFLNEEH